MQHFSCDSCGKTISPEVEDRYVVRIDAYPAEPGLPDLTAADLDRDSVEAMADLLEELEGNDASAATSVAPARTTFEYDLCPACLRRFVADPLGRDQRRKLRFSPN